MPFLIASGLLSMGMTLAAVLPASAEAGGAFRPPAVPLVTHDPYFSVWSCANRLTDDVTRHWTKASQSLTSMVRIDGKIYRLMGDEPKSAPPMGQTGLQVLPTRTIYHFENSEVRVTLTFTTPELPDDLSVLARPVTYLTWEVQSKDGRKHSVSVYFSASSELAVNTPDEKVVWSREKMGNLAALRIGTADQPILQMKGDGVRINWGYAYVAAPMESTQYVVGSTDNCRQAFLKSGGLPGKNDPRMPRAVDDDQPVMAFVLDMGEVGSEPVSRYLIVAYDDIYSINYFGEWLRPYWRRNGADMADLLDESARDYSALQQRCRAFDHELMSDLRTVGGEKYAQICALAYRQCLAGTMLAADSNGQPMLFPKENTSNGCISTVDVIYPMDPMFLLLSPALAKASLVPVLNYAASPKWPFLFAPHDLGTFPDAVGQVYGGPLSQAQQGNMMPVEESGNMILLMAAIAREEGNADFASRYWALATRWAHYLEAKGFDPANQLCTDDFTGHLAHNANLSLKAIEALGAYGLLCRMRGDQADAEKFHRIAEEMAQRWTQTDNDGDHYRLAFDRPGTWSQKYNLVWDRILGLNLFSPKVERTEMAFYLNHLNQYGLPLDSRQTFTKTDWSLWTATLAQNESEFKELVSKVYAFLNDTPDRVPMSDFYWTQNAQDAGMHARPVVGGVFLKMLTDPTMWKKWASRGQDVADRWAPMPPPPVVKVLIPSGLNEPVMWRYTTDRPSENWYQPGFNDARWSQGPAGFGTAGTPAVVVRTTWNTSDIWLRRHFTMPKRLLHDLDLQVFHDEDVEIYINGVLAAKMPGYITEYDLVPINATARAALKPGENLLAVHCHQTVGGQGVDVGIVELKRK